MSIDEMIAVCEAAKKGRAIEEEVPYGWRRASLHNLLETCKLRVAREPREIWADPISKNTTHYAYNSKAEFIAACSDGRYECNPRLFREVMEDNA